MEEPQRYYNVAITDANIGEPFKPTPSSSLWTVEVTVHGQVPDDSFAVRQQISADRHSIVLYSVRVKNNPKSTDPVPFTIKEQLVGYVSPDMATIHVRNTPLPSPPVQPRMPHSDKQLKFLVSLREQMQAYLSGLYDAMSTDDTQAKEMYVLELAATSGRLGHLLSTSQINQQKTEQLWMALIRAQLAGDLTLVPTRAYDLARHLAWNDEQTSVLLSLVQQIEWMRDALADNAWSDAAKSKTDAKQELTTLAHMIYNQQLPQGGFR